MEIYLTPSFSAESYGRLQPNDPCGPWASLAQQPIDSAASLPRFHGSCSCGPLPACRVVRAASLVCRTGARACSHGRACPRGACRLGGPGGRLGLMSGGLASGRGSSLGLEFLEAVAVHLLLAENYNRTTTDNTTRVAERTETSRLRLRGHLQFCDPCELGLASPSSPSGMLLPCLGFTAAGRRA